MLVGYEVILITFRVMWKLIFDLNGSRLGQFIGYMDFEFTGNFDKHRFMKW